MSWIMRPFGPTLPFCGEEVVDRHLVQLAATASVSSVPAASIAFRYCVTAE